jgi:hypothetical protein
LTIREFAKNYSLHLRGNDCRDPVIFGRLLKRWHARQPAPRNAVEKRVGHIYEHNSAVLELMFTPRRQFFWKSLRRKLLAVGSALHQNGTGEMRGFEG